MLYNIVVGTFAYRILDSERTTTQFSRIIPATIICATLKLGPKDQNYESVQSVSFLELSLLPLFVHNYDWAPKIRIMIVPKSPSFVIFIYVQC